MPAVTLLRTLSEISSGDRPSTSRAVSSAPPRGSSSFEHGHTDVEGENLALVDEVKTAEVSGALRDIQPTSDAERRMGDRSGIEWTETTWNPVTGCSRVSPGVPTAMPSTLPRG